MSCAVQKVATMWQTSQEGIGHVFHHEYSYICNTSMNPHITQERAGTPTHRHQFPPSSHSLKHKDTTSVIILLSSFGVT